MIETITLDTRKVYSPSGALRISPLRRGERNNVTLTVVVRCDRRPYDLTGMTAHLVWKAADGKLVGPVPMEVTDPTAGTVRCTLPDACYSAVGTAHAYIELRRGADIVDTTDEMHISVLDCIDADAEQAEEYKPLIAEARDATDAAVKATERVGSGEDERVKAEAERVSAENARKQAEAEREQGWADLKADASSAKADASAAKSAIDAHASDTGNPHHVTADQLGLGDVKAQLAGKQDRLNSSSGVAVGRLAVQGSNESAKTSEYLAISGSARGAMTIGGILPESSDGALSISAFNHGANHFACEEGSDKATFSIAENAWIKNDAYIYPILSKYSTTEGFAVSLLKEMFTGAAIITNETQDFVGFVKSVDSVNRSTLTLSVTMDRKLTGKSTPAQHQYLLRNRGNCNLTMYSQATSDFGFAIGGPNNIVTGRCSGAIGNTSFVTCPNSMAIGSKNIVNKNFALAMLIGDLNYAIGKEKSKDGRELYSRMSYVFGHQNNVRRSYVVAAGFGLTVYEDGDAAEFDGSDMLVTPVVVTGRYNDVYVKKNHPNAAFIVGNGTSTNRSDGLVVNTDGTVEMDSLVLVKQDGTKVMLTADALEKVVSGDCYTKAEVDALVKSLTDRVAALEKASS